jgi:arginase
MQASAADRPYAIVEAPSILGLRPTGVEQLPAALTELGLPRRLGARVAARLEPPAYDDRRDPATQTRNAGAIAAWSPRLADAIESVLDARDFPIVLGGDCSILLGSMLALRRRGRYGLLFLDGHADYYQPDANPSGEAASMELAFATGHGPPLLADLEGRAPLVEPRDVVGFGMRDADEQRAYGSQPLAPEIVALDLPSIRRLGSPAAIRIAVDHLTHDALAGFFIHLDVDCLDDAVMPAVDYRLPGGLSWRELGAILHAALATGRAVGLELAIYNPTLDRDLVAGRALVATLVHALR